MDTQLNVLNKVPPEKIADDSTGREPLDLEIKVENSAQLRTDEALQPRKMTTGKNKSAAAPKNKIMSVTDKSEQMKKLFNQRKSRCYPNLSPMEINDIEAKIREGY